MNALRVLLRLAARDARRDRGRSLLVLIMVLLPVAGLVGVITFADSATPTAADHVTAQLGSAAALASPGGPEADLDELRATLPEGSRVEVVITTTAGSIATDGRFRSVSLSDQDLSPDGFGVGGLQLESGDVPAEDDEVVVSRAVADATGTAPGATLEIEPLGEVTVTGVVLDPQRLSSMTAVTAPQALRGTGELYAETVYLADPTGDLASDPSGTLGRLAVDVHASGPAEIADGSWFVRSRTGIAEEGRVSRGERWALLVVGGLAAVEVALVAGAAFAVSVRRRQRELGLLAACGGTSRHVRAAVLLTGVTVGVGGALLGAALGVLAAWGATLTPLAERVLDRELGGLLIDPVWVASCVALGAAAAIAGAWWPARSVARLPVLTALAGRRPVSLPSRRTAAGGVILVLAGGALTLTTAGGVGELTPFVFLAGSVLVVLGAGLTSPFLLEQLGRLAGRLPTGPRLAVRDAARFRTRNGPIVTAAMAGLAASVTLATGLGTAHADSVATYRASLPEDVAVLEGDARSLGLAAPAVATALGADVLEVGTSEVVVENAEGDFLYVDVVTPEAAARLHGADAGAALGRGEVVVLDADLAGRGPWTLSLLDPSTGSGAGEPLGDVEVLVLERSGEGDAEDGFWPQFGLPQVMITPDRLAELGAPAPVLSRVLLAGDAAFDEAQVRDATAVAAGVGDDLALRVEEGPSMELRQVQWAATGLGILAGLLIVTVAIALAAAEARGDARTLRAVGAGARTRRSVAAGRALLLSGLGGVLAVPVGLVPAVAVLSTAGFAVPVQVPWATIALVAVGVPMITTLGAVLVAQLGREDLSRAA